jgi:hypothetical protein
MDQAQLALSVICAQLNYARGYSLMTSSLLSHSRICQQLWGRLPLGLKAKFEALLPILAHAYDNRLSLDTDPQGIHQLVNALCALDPGVMMPRVSPLFGGWGLDIAQAHLLKMLAARASGALNFVLTQNQTAADAIAASDSPQKAKWLRDMYHGELWGISRSPHLARPEKPTVTGVALADGGYCLSADLRWVTGFGYVSHAVVGFVDLEANTEVTVRLPFANTHQSGGGQITCTTPAVTKAASAANTVSLQIRDWRITPDEVMTKQPLGTFKERVKYHTNLDSYQTGVIAEILVFIKQGATHPLTSTIIDDFTSQLTALETMIIQREKNTDIQEIRALSIALFNDISAIARQLLQGRALLKEDPLITYFDLLQAEGALYAAAVPSENLLELLYQQTMTRYQAHQPTHTELMR